MHRQGTRVEEDLGRIRFQGSDTLLLLTNPHFMKLHAKDKDTFASLTEHKGYGEQHGRGPRSWKASRSHIVTPPPVTPFFTMTPRILILDVFSEGHRAPKAVETTSRIQNKLI